MRDAKVKDLRARSDKAWAHLRAQLHGMDPYLDRSDIPGEWTAREVLCHLLFEPGWKPVPLLKTFAVTDLPVVHVNPGDADVTGNRKTMTLKQFTAALEGQQRDVMNYLEGLSEADLHRRRAFPSSRRSWGSKRSTSPPSWARCSSTTGTTTRDRSRRSGSR